MKQKILFGKAMNNLKTFTGIVLLSFVFGILGSFVGNNVLIPMIWSKYAGEEQIVKKVIEQKTYVEESSIINAVKKVSPAVVSIIISKDLSTYKTNRYFFNPFYDDPNFQQFFYFPGADEEVVTTKKKIGGGSGLIFTSDGLILTNKHVVDDEAASYTVLLNDGGEFQAEVLGKDILNDIAVLKLIPKKGEVIEGLPVIEIGDSEKIQIGQRVVAIGYALAEYQNTVTTGVISATGQQIAATDGLGRRSGILSGLIQTDASINPGNSGGPLVNLNGEVIGINTAIVANAAGIGFSIPINDVKVIINSIKKHGKIIRPFLGVRYINLDPGIAKDLEIDQTHGALLVGDGLKGEFAVIPGSPAENAGLINKDIILEINGTKLTKEKDLKSIISEYNVDDELTMKIWRSGEEKTLTLTLEEAK